MSVHQPERDRDVVVLTLGRVGLLLVGCVGDCSEKMYEDLVRNRYGAIDVDQVPLDLNKGDLGKYFQGYLRIFKTQHLPHH